MNIAVMNFNDAKSIGEQPKEFCIEDVREALRVLREKAERSRSSTKDASDHARYIRKLEAEIASGRTE